MLSVKVDTTQVKRLMQTFPKQVERATEMALDKTAFEVRDAVKKEMKNVFASPTPYTMNSLKVTKTKGHNMKAEVWFKEPDRMTHHYLEPQVFGGSRPYKGFERALGNKFYVPSDAQTMDRYGNLSAGKIRQVLSVLRRAEMTAGYSANITARSKRTNRKPRDYVLIRRGNNLPPGVYERYQTGVGFGAKTKKTLPFGVYQKGVTRGRFSSVIRARGLRPVLVETRKPRYRKRLPFFEVGQKVINARFNVIFREQFGRVMASGGWSVA